MKKTQQAIIEAAYGVWDEGVAEGGEEIKKLYAAVDADRANTDPEPEVMTLEVKALIEAANDKASQYRLLMENLKGIPVAFDGLMGKLVMASDAYIASRKPKLEVPWPDAGVVSVYARLYAIKRGDLYLKHNRDWAAIDNDQDEADWLWLGLDETHAVLRRARRTKMKSEYPDASVEDITAALDAFGKDGAK